MPSPRPLAMVVMLAASTSYACPIGYATNLMVLGPGGYTFADFLRVGLIMEVLMAVPTRVLTMMSKSVSRGAPELQTGTLQWTSPGYFSFSPSMVALRVLTMMS